MMEANSLHLLHALNAAAAVLQRTSHSEAEVLNASRDEIARLGFRGGLSLLDDTGECLVVTTTVQPQWMAKILADLEKRTGYKSRDYSFPVQRVSVYRQAIETRQAVFLPDSSQTIAEMLPDPVRPIAGIIIKALGAPPGVYAPLNSQDRPIGVLNVVGNGLTPDDVPAVEAFANHIAIALENAKLFHALYDSEQRFRTLADAAFEGIALTEHGIFVDLNDQLAQMLGYRRDELMNKPILCVVAAESQDRVAQAIRADQFEPYEHLALRKDGTIFPVEVRARTARIGERQVRITAIRDVTERRQAEEALRASEDKFSTAFHTSPDSININRLSDGLYLEINAGFTTLTGYTPEEVRGKTSAELDIWVDMDDRARLIKKLREQAIVNNLEAQFRRKDGTTGIGLMSARIVQVNGERCILSVTREITERKQAEVEREKLIAKLETQNAELERFIYTVSHDLKSPLVTIRGFLGFLEQDMHTGNLEQANADIARIVKATDKMQRLLGELVELSRIGRMMNPSEAVPFEVIVREAVELVRGRIEAHGVHVEIEPELPTAYGDRARLVEVVQNLVDNACKFMGDQAEPRITIGQRGADSDGKPILFVRDNGIGIDPCYHEKVFDLFDKLDPKSEGTGIGLALVKRIVEVHGGRIWVESEAGHGSTFYFTLAMSAHSE